MLASLVGPRPGRNARRDAEHWLLRKLVPICDMILHLTDPWFKIANAVRYGTARAEWFLNAVSTLRLIYIFGAHATLRLLYCPLGK